MTIHSASGEEHFMATSHEILRNSQVELTIGTDFREYRELLAEGRPDHMIGAPFDPNRHRLDASNGVWIVGRDESGLIMHTQALRCLDLKEDPLSVYLKKNYKGFPPSGMDIDYARSRYRPGPGAQRIAGKVVYHGEVWMGGQPGRYRGTGLSCVLGRYAFLTALQRFSPDHVIGFMPKPVAFKGFAERQGYMHAEPMCLRWFVKGSDEPLEGFMVYMSNEDIRFILDMPLRELLALAA